MENEFNAVNAVAYDLMRKNAQAENKIPPCWLCLSDEAKQEAKDDLLDFLRDATENPYMSEEEMTELVEDRIPDYLINKWQEVEEMFLQERQNNNPLALQ